MKRARSTKRTVAWIGRLCLCVLFVTAAVFTGRQFAATIERVGGPAPLMILSAPGELTPQASRRMDSICSETAESLPTAESLRYCGLANLVDRPGATDADKAQRYAASVDYLKRSLDRAPYDGITWLYLAAASLAEGDRANAAESFDTSYEVAPIAVGMQGMRLGIGLSMVDTLPPITRMSLDSEVVMLGTRDARYLYRIAEATGQIRYVAGALTADLPTFARFVRIAREPPPGIRR